MHRTTRSAFLTDAGLRLIERLRPAIDRITDTLESLNQKQRWRDDFNARRADHICDLFARDLRYDFQGLPEQTYTLLCNRLHRALADQAQSYHYDLRIKEILVSGDLAVVRLTWTSTLTGKGGRQLVEDEPGLDMYERQSDGGWRSSATSPIPRIPGRDCDPGRAAAVI
ncbi:MAG TPA: nuclear transport factor 2 family protein [Acetobacteraceae bacterium]|nr:nuclear transport factor 2 family protein [Acetobacteraceae bacterium]